jgi:hypothetical protein
MAQALRERGVAPLVADLAADVGARAFYGALERWTSAADQRTFGEHALEVFGELKAAISELERTGGPAAETPSGTGSRTN